MKLAITLMVIGGLLLAEGGSRIAVGLATGNLALVLGGILTGILLGSFLLYKGIKRYKRRGDSSALKSFKVDDIRDYQEVLSCPTCVFFKGRIMCDDKAMPNVTDNDNYPIWCNAPQSSDIKGTYCSTFKAKESESLGDKR